MNRIFFHCLVMLLCCATVSFCQGQKVTSFSVTFKIKNFGATVDGSFKKGSAKINFNEASPNLSTFEGSVEANSISTGNKLRDGHLKDKEEFFNVVKYPTLTMKSVTVEKISEGNYQITWDITMKGITRRLKAPMSITAAANNSKQFSSEFKINRNEWKVGGSSMTMGDAVTIKIQATTTK
jgi:polyisoprenoid-binding protein YceI